MRTEENRTLTHRKKHSRGHYLRFKNVLNCRKFAGNRTEICRKLTEINFPTVPTYDIQGVPKIASKIEKK